MKPITSLAIAAFCGSVLLDTGCKKANGPKMEAYTYTLYTPVKFKRSEIYADLNGPSNQSIDTAGKIYVKDQFIYINEVDKGIHVIDNTNPSHPFQTAFLSIPGNRDIAIKNNILYADMFSELLAINIEDVHHAAIEADVRNVFPNRGLWYEADTANMVMGYLMRDTTVMQLVNEMPGCPNCEFLASTSGGAIAKSNGNGKAGSMARMALMDNYLYAIAEGHTLSVIDVTNPSAPAGVSQVNAGFDLETIFLFENKLFLGSAEGVYMFDVSDRRQPKAIGSFTHGRACDPVIADGDYAYVTLHAGTSCGGDANELDVLSIKDITRPILLHAYSMTSPKGLSKDKSLLFVCDGTDAIKIFNAANPGQLKLLTTFNCPDPYDVITGGNTAMVVARKGIYKTHLTAEVSANSGV
jgi:hypothetical protein